MDTEARRAQEQFPSPGTPGEGRVRALTPTLSRSTGRGGRGDLAKGLAFLSPWIIGFSVFTAIPIGLSLYFSFTEYSLLKPPVFIGLENYRELLRDQWFWNALSVTGRYALMALPAGMCVSLGLAIL